MKLKTRIAGFITAVLFATPALAGSVAGTGGSTEVTQILNNLQLIQSYEQQVQSYVMQGRQVEAELKNLISNPTSILGPDVGQMINTIGQIWSGGQSIGYNLAQIDQNFARTFKSPTAGSHKGFSAGSYKDMTRVAWLNAPMWSELFLCNREALLGELDSYRAQLDDLRAALALNDGERLEEVFGIARQARRNWAGEP